MSAYIESFKKQGWHIVDWQKDIPEVGDYIQAVTTTMQNLYSCKITGIGEDVFVAKSNSSSISKEYLYNKYDEVYLFKKKGSGHPLIGGCGVENEINNHH